MTEQQVSELVDFERGEFTPREKAAFKFAELMATNHYAVDDEIFDELRQHFNETEIIELGWVVAMSIGVGRFIFALDVEPH